MAQWPVIYESSTMIRFKCKGRYWLIQSQHKHRVWRFRTSMLAFSDSRFLTQTYKVKRHIRGNSLLSVTSHHHALTNIMCHAGRYNNTTEWWLWKHVASAARRFSWWSLSIGAVAHRKYSWYHKIINSGWACWGRWLNVRNKLTGVDRRSYK